MRLVIKARSHKYIKKWRGPTGDWQYKYAKPKSPARKKSVDKKDYLLQEKGAFIFAVKPKVFYTKADERDAKIRVPSQYMYGAFKKFNRTFVVHRTMRNNKVLGKGLTVTDTMTGKTFKIEDMTDVEAMIEKTVAKMDEFGFRRVQKYLGTQDVKDMPDYLSKAHTRHDAAILWLQNAMGELGIREYLEEWAKGNMIDLEKLGGDNDRWEKEVFGGATPMSDMDEIIIAAVQQDKHPNAVFKEGMAYRGKEAKMNVLAEQLAPDAPAYDSGKGVYYDLPPKRAEKAMKRGRVIGQKVLGGGINATYRLQLEDGDEAEAVWKPEAGELHFYQPGILTRPKIPRDWYKRESAVYELDRILGFDLVPATVIREIKGEIGSLQFFKQGAVNASMIFPWDQHCLVEDRQKAMIIDFLCYNQDRHARNFMIGPDEELILIDNGLSFPIEEDRNYYTKFRYSAGVTGNIPSDVLAKMKRVGSGKIASKLRRIGLEESAVQGFLDRWDRALEGNIPAGHLWRQPEEVQAAEVKQGAPRKIDVVTGSAFWEKR